MNKLRWLALLMVIAIIGITGFQGYWLRENYAREKQNLDIKTNAAFRQSILKLQASKIRLEQINFRTESLNPRIKMRANTKNKPARLSWTATTTKTSEPPISVINLMQEKARQFEKTGPGGDDGRIIISSVSERKSVENGDSIRSFVITRKGLDSIRPEMIRRINVMPDTAMKNEVVLNYKSDGSAKNIQQDMEFNGPLPTPPDMIMPRLHHDTGHNAFVQLVYSMDSLSIRDSVTLQEVDSAFSSRLKEENLNLSFSVAKFDSSYGPAVLPNEVTLGLSIPVTYRLNLLSPSNYVLKQLKMPILFSLLLVGITIASFALLYRNLIRQHRLSQMKNDLISNITHELKTPIATVGVAIEALKNFNAIDDPKRTKEYLDISQNELQRLELLVDKVLKLSMFENKQIALQKEYFNLEQVVKEVMSSLKFQIDKQQATVAFETRGDQFQLYADKLHITSVVYNLLDNALKYSGRNASIQVQLVSHKGYAELIVKDNGIGIPAEYQKRIFDKFFRVPSGDKHNIKGYGLGLSYVDHIIQTHQGNIQVVSELEKGSTFIVSLPYGNAATTTSDHGNKI